MAPLRAAAMFASVAGLALALSVLAAPTALAPAELVGASTRYDIVEAHMDLDDECSDEACSMNALQLRRQTMKVEPLEEGLRTSCPPTAEPALTVRFGTEPSRILRLEELPLAVPAHSNVSILVCNWANNAASNATPAGPSGLVGDIGSSVDVRIDVVNSWNIVVDGEVAVGGMAPAGVRHLPALLPRLVSGRLGDGAAVRIACRRSGNVLLATRGSALRVGKGGSLVGDLMLVQGAGLASTNVEIDVDDSGNVIAAEGGDLSVEGGFLVGSLLSCAGAANSTFRLRVANSSNVETAAVRVASGSLLATVLASSGRLERTNATVELRHVGEVRAESVNLVGGDIVEEAVKCEADLDSSAVSVDEQNVGNVVAAMLDIDDGDLLDEVVDVAHVRASQVRVGMRHIANARATQLVKVASGELLDEVVDAEDIEKSTIEVREADVANVDAWELYLKEGILADEAVDADAIRDSTVTVALASVASFHGANLHNDGGKLMDEAVDADASSGNTIVVSLSNVGGRGGPPEEGAPHAGAQIDDMVDVSLAGGADTAVAAHARRVKRSSVLGMARAQLRSS